MIQEQIEQLFSKQNKANIVLAELNEDKVFTDRVLQGVYLLQEYFQKEYDEVKDNRLATVWQQYEDIDKLKELIETVFVATTQMKDAMPLVSLASMLSGQIKNLIKPAAIHTMAEILAVLWRTDMYVLFNRSGQIYLRNIVTLEEETQRRVSHLMYLPPMISPPKIVTKNRDNFYYSLKPESLLLGVKDAHHNGDISLDVINTLSQQALRIDTKFYEEHRPIKPEGMKQHDWDIFVNQMDYIYSFINSNDIYIPYKADMRGRVYTQAYHFDTMGDDFHKSVIDLATKVIIEVD